MIIKDLKDLLDEVGVTIDGIKCLYLDDAKELLSKKGLSITESYHQLNTLITSNYINLKMDDLGNIFIIIKEV